MKNSILWRAAAALGVIGALSTAAVAVTLLAMPPRAVMLELGGRNERTLILDAGHGGADGGAVSVTGTYESALNLAITLRLEALAELYGVVPVLTRQSEDIDYPEDAATIHAKKVADTKAREALIDSFDDAILVSIHQNKYTTSQPRGSQVFYAPTEGSQALAEAVQGALAGVSEDNHRGVVRIGKGVYLMNHIACPGVLVECGFVSNPAEARLLEDTTYQLKLAAAVLGGVLQGIG